MKAIFTETALADLEDLIRHTSENYPGRLAAIQRRIRDVITRIETWPESARTVIQRPEVRVAPLIRFPYRIFYTIRDGRIEILHIHHAARRAWIK